ncbi:transcriptional regulator [Amycolatopsis bartoniae]|uniref:Transcriptional regulator n=1 Tax=Amycolatopsis bartoniae TaxID=941986 RepID=A0A8H9IQK6_9PSEU|nr:transcriptional regulator [Amycolatopsis bartoniae]
MSQPDARRELGAFLRSRRARITPADAGLPRTGRRRTPGLRREELALLAGISATWYTYLEQGRDVRPSDQVLGALARALRLSDPERDHLFRLANGERTPQEPAPGQAAAVPLLLQPNPAYLTGPRYDVLGWNPAAAELFPGIDAAPNLARWVFTSPFARDVLTDWELVARGLLARLRAAAGRHPGDPLFAALVRELRAASPEADAWWPRYDIQAAQAGTKRVRHPRLGPLTLAHSAFHPAGQPEHTLVVYALP